LAKEWLAEKPAVGPEIDARLDRLHGAVVVYVRGAVDRTSSPELETCIRFAMASERVVIVDLSECTYIDCSVLSVLIRARRGLVMNLRVIVPHDAFIRRLFALSVLLDFLNVEATLESAVSRIATGNSGDATTGEDRDV
jgi:anti-anti-sigma factor